MHLTVVETPFSIPSDLGDVLIAMPLEYGTGGGIGETLPAVRVWKMVDDNVTVGYVWLAKGRIHETERFCINIAVLPDYRGQGMGTSALSEIESILASEGHSHVFAQVNSNVATTGLRVRQWLRRFGYEVVRWEILDHYQSATDEELVMKYAAPLVFAKELPPSSNVERT